MVSLIDLGAPRCGEAGPAVEILQARRVSCGKGDTCTLLDQRIRNPEDRALWLLVDTTSDFAGYLESVRILRPWDAAAPPVWEFSGQNYHQAFRVSLGKWCAQTIPVPDEPPTLPANPASPKPEPQ